MNSSITLVDVAPRDGIQNEKIMLSSAQKLELIRRLADAGMKWIEVASYASPKWVPQMADAEEVFRAAATIPESVRSCSSSTTVATIARSRPVPDIFASSSPPPKP